MSQSNVIRFASRSKIQGLPFLPLILVLSVIGAGCAVTSQNTGLPELPPAPVISSGTFQVNNNFAACPAGSTPSNPTAVLCTMTGGTGTVDVLPDAFLGSTYFFAVPTRGGTLPVTNCLVQNGPVDSTGQQILVGVPNGASCDIRGTFPATLSSVTIPTGGFAALQMTIQASDSGNPAANDTQDIVIRIFAGFSFGTSALENGTQGRAYTKTITTNLGGGAGVPPLTACSAAITPAGSGLSVTGFSGSNCTFSGTAGTAGTYSVTFTATDSANPPNPRTSSAIPLVINPPLSLSTPTYAAGTSGRAYAAVTLTRTGGQVPITCSDSGTTLPPGMTVTTTSNDCVVAGTPTASGTFNVVITAQDTATATTAAGSFSTTAVQMIINPGLAITTVANTILDAVNSRTYVTPAFTNSGGNAPFTWSATGLGSGSCAGLTMSAAGVVSGTPTTPGTCNFTAIVTDTATATTPAGNTSAPFTITVRGEFALASPNFVDGVEQRTYGNAPQAHIVATSPAVLGVAGASDFGQTAEIGNGPLSACAVTAVSVTGGTPGTPLTTANFTALVDPTDNSRCRVQSVGAFPTGSAADYLVTVSATDNAIGTFTPLATKTSSGKLTVQPALALAVNLADPLPTAAIGRSYGQGNICGPAGGLACTPVIYTASGGIAPYAIGVSAGAFPAGFASVAAATTLTFSSANVTGAATSPVTVAVTDAGNTAVPAAPGVPVAIVRNIAVVADVVLTPNAAGAAPPDGVQGRTYGGSAAICGVAGNAACQVLQYTATLGLGGYAYTPIPTIGAPGAGVPGTPGVVCSDTAGVMTCGSSGGTAVITAGIGAYSFTVRLTDTGNASTPGRGFSALGSQTLGPLTINVRGPIGFLSVSQPDPLSVAVNGRPWGDPATLCKATVANGAPGTVACVGVTYTATGGLGGYVFVTPATSGSPAAAFPNGFTFATVGADFKALAPAPGGVTGGAGTYSNIPVTVDDTPNLSTPTAINSATAQTVTRSITVNAALTYTANVGTTVDNSTTPPSFTVTNPDGVAGRVYGAPSNPGRVDLLWTALGGLGNFSFFGGTTFTPPSLINGSFFLAGPGVLGANSQGSAFGGAGNTPGTYNYDIFVQDDIVTAALKNPSTPGGTIMHNNVLIIRPVIAQATAPTSPLPTARQNSSYGTAGAGCSGGACLPVTFTANPATGLGTFVFGSSGFPAGIACTPAANVLTCSSANVTTGAAAFTPQVTINDTANATTLDHAAVNGGVPFTVNETMTVVDDLVITAISFVGGNGTISRNFGTGTGIPGPGVPPQPVNVGFTGGISGFICSANAAVTTIGLDVLAAAVGTNCRFDNTKAPNANGTFPGLTVTVTDSNNQSTPTDTSTTAGMSLDVNVALALSAPALGNAVTGTLYSASVASNASGGQTPYTFTLTGAGWIAGTPFTNATGACTGLTFDGTAGTFGGTPTIAGACGPFNLTVNDSQTTTTGTANATATAPAAQSITITVSTPVALAAAPELQVANAGDGTEGIAFGTGSGGPVDFAISNGTGSFQCSATTTGGLTLGGGGLDVALVAGPACRLQGTPTAAQIGAGFTVTVTVTDTGVTPNQTASQTTAAFDINAALAIGPVPTLAAGVVHDAVEGQGYSLLIPTSGGETPRTFTNPGGTANPAGSLGADADCDNIALNTGTNTLETSGGFPPAPSGTPACPFNLRLSGTRTTTTDGTHAGDPDGSLGVGSVLVPHTFTLRAALTITTVQGALVNGLLGAAYNGGNSVTFNTNRPGVGTLTWLDPNDGAAAPCAAPTGTLRFAAGDFSSAGVLSGSPTSASTATNETFQICVKDSGNPAVSAHAAAPVSYVILVMNRYIYVAEPAVDQVNVIDSATNLEVDTDGGGAPLGRALTAGDNPEDVVVSPNGRRAFVTANGANVVRVIDTISHAVIDTVTLGTCTGPRGIAAERVSGTTDRVYVACTNGQFATFDANALVPIGAASAAALTGAGLLDSVTFRNNANHDRVYFTDQTNNRVYAVDTTGAGTSPVDLGGTDGSFVLSTGTGFGSSPRGILGLTNGANQYIYVAMEVDDGSSNESWVHVFNVNTDTPAAVAGTPVEVGTNENNAGPLYMAHDAQNNVIYITRNGQNDITQINNNVATPVRSVTGTVVTGTTPVGVTVPPVTGRVYASANANDRVDHFTLTAFGTAPTGAANIALDGATLPRRINHIPVPR